MESSVKTPEYVPHGGRCSAEWGYCQNMNTVVDLRSPDPPVKIKISVIVAYRQSDGEMEGL